MSDWSKEALRARVDKVARECEGDEFVAEIERFGRSQLSRRERHLLYDVLMERADMRGRIADAAQERVRSGWTRRMLQGRVGRRPRSS